MPNQHHTEYAPPVLRAPSPASSVGTAYGADQTSFSDSESQSNQEMFEKKWEERLELGEPRWEEELANADPLLDHPPKGSAEEQMIYERVMQSLREEVQRLEENELFDKTLLQDSQIALEQQPATTDIDALMRSLMVAPSSSKNTASGRRQSNRNNGSGTGITNSPWTMNGHGSRYDGTGVNPPLSSESKANKRSRNGSSRNP